MIRISNISQGLEEDFSSLQEKTAKILKISSQEITHLQIVRQSVDARKKNQIHYSTTVDVILENKIKEEKILKNPPSKQITSVQVEEYHFPEVKKRPANPVIVGLGPSGLFAALFLARAGIPSVILERGDEVDTRSAMVEEFMKTGKLSSRSNIQFGEGGAGTFSDGKLTTGTNDPRKKILMESLVEAGAPADILYSHKPHIGTDVLRDVLKNIRKELISLGCDLRFCHKLVDIQAEGDTISSLTVESLSQQYQLPASHVILATGHSARDTFTMLYERNIPLEGKNFAIGVRIEHFQSQMGMAQYGEDYAKLPPTDYKLACHLPSGRSAFSFCVCPGGEVVGATSEEERVVTNGMSYRSRGGKNINGGLLVGVSPVDFEPFGKNHPLSGMWFQDYWEKVTFQQGGGNYHAPCQRVEDFLKMRPSTSCGEIQPTYGPGVTYGEIDPCLPKEIVDTLRESIPLLGKKVKGFDCPDALLTGIETRSSSPLRMLRDSTYQSTLKGLFPCGEGAGFAGGIVSAAVDGIKVAEALVQGLWE